MPIGVLFLDLNAGVIFLQPKTNQSGDKILGREEMSRMAKKIFIPEKYGMTICPDCNSQGYIKYPKRQPCPRCGGFGFIKREIEQNAAIFNGNK